MRRCKVEAKVSERSCKSDEDASS